MKKVAAALIMLTLTSPGFASDDSIVVPELTALPFVVNSAGEQASAYIKNWGSLGQGKGTFSTAGSRVTDLLEANKCAIHFRVSRNTSGRLDPANGLATIACMQQGGSVVATDVPGTFFDPSGTLGLKEIEPGEKGFFLVQSALRIPLASE